MLIFKTTIFLSLPLFFSLVPVAVRGDINWGDCNKKQQGILRLALSSARAMTERTAQRLQVLGEYIQDTNRRPIEQEYGVLPSTFRTYIRFLDYSLYTTKDGVYDDEGRKAAIGRLYRVFSLAKTLEKNIDSVLKKDLYGYPIEQPEPYINFFCSDDWIGEMRGLDENNQPLFEDNRKVSQGGSPLRRGLLFALGGSARLPYRTAPGTAPLRNYLVKDLPPPYTSVISINDLWMFRDGVSYPLPRIPGTFHDPSSPAARRGENEYDIMRQDGSIMPRSWRLDEIIPHHLDLKLIVFLSRTDTMATDHNTGINYTLGTKPDHCERLLEIMGANVDIRRYWQCVYRVAESLPDEAIHSCRVNQFLTLAMFLERWDWSTAINIPTELVRHHFHELYRFGSALSPKPA